MSVSVCLHPCVCVCVCVCIYIHVSPKDEGRLWVSCHYSNSSISLFLHPNSRVTCGFVGGHLNKNQFHTLPQQDFLPTELSPKPQDIRIFSGKFSYLTFLSSLPLHSHPIHSPYLFSLLLLIPFFLFCLSLFSFSPIFSLPYNQKKFITWPKYILKRRLWVFRKIHISGI